MLPWQGSWALSKRWTSQAHELLTCTCKVHKQNLNDLNVTTVANFKVRPFGYLEIHHYPHVYCQKSRPGFDLGLMTIYENSIYSTHSKPSICCSLWALFCQEFCSCLTLGQWHSELKGTIHTTWSTSKPSKTVIKVGVGDCFRDRKPVYFKLDQLVKPNCSEES